MATILSLKRRIQAAQNVSKTTRAMQMISASKLKKAQQRAISTRPYVKQLDIMTKNVLGKIDLETFHHPYVKAGSKTGKTLMIILAPDKGLCGGLISNLLRAFIGYQKEEVDAFYVVVGRKVEGLIARLSKQVIATFNFGITTPSFDVIYGVMKIVDDYYMEGKVDKVKVLFTDFTSFFSQNPTRADLLPVKLTDENLETKDSTLYYIFEPRAEEILPSLLRHNIEMSLYHFYLESFASEQASRMLTMQNATNNANDIIEDLRLEYNITRQAKITSELLDITGAGIATA